MSENLQVLSAVHGIAPRSEELFRLGTDCEKGRASRAAIDEQIDAETQAWLEAQALAGIDLPENGNLRWQDHLRPIVKASTGFAPDIDNAPLQRWYEDNRFYRQPTIHDWPRFYPAGFEQTTGSPGENFSVIDGRTFSELCAKATQALPADSQDAETTLQIYGLYQDLFAYLQQTGVKHVLLEGYDGREKADPSLGHELAEEFPDISVGYAVIGEDPSQTLSHVGDRYTPNKEVVLQVIDSTTTAKDTVDLTNWPLQKLRDHRPERLILTHSVDLECLPLPYAIEKIQRLGELTAQITDFIKEEL